jgi:two-component system sensor histidine kinase UhpB
MPNEELNQLLNDPCVFANDTEQTLRILLLEDLLSDAELIKLQLRRLKFSKEIEHVTNREDFEERFNRFKPHVILSDYALPQFTGMEALEYVREQNPFIPFIICTGSVNEETAVACIKAGADDYVLKDSMGRLVSAVENALQSKTNLVEKERAMHNLESSEANFRALAENAPDNIYKLDRDGTILYVSRSVNGTPKEQVLGSSIYDYVVEQDCQRLQTAIEKVFEEKSKVSIELLGYARNNEQRNYLVRLGPVENEGKVDSVVFIPGDITHRVQAEAEMKHLNEKLHHLTQHLETIRDEEKKKIAMEIHDQLGQELTGNKLGLFWIKQELESKAPEDVDIPAVIEKIDYLVDLTTTTIQTVRRIAHELRPVVLDDMGLVAALEWHVSNYNENHSVVCHLTIDTGNISFGKEFSTAVYRLTQEALTNVNRHADATEAWVELKTMGKQLVLRIRDNGKGIDKERAMKSKSLGLFGMRERIKKWDGSFDLDGQPGKGTTITMHFDLSSIESEIEKA